MLGAAPGESWSVCSTHYRLFEDRCGAELQQTVGRHGCQRPWEKGK